MIIAKIESAALSVKLWMMMRQIQNPLALYKTWSTVVVNKARANARAKGGKRLWKQIADYTKVSRCSQRGAIIECLSYIGAHKEYGGPIRVKNKSWLTIPISELAYGKTAGEIELSGIKLFRPGRKEAKKNILAYSDAAGTLVPVFALCKQTRPQRADKWWPDHRWVLEQGVKEAKWHIEKRH